MEMNNRTTSLLLVALFVISTMTALVTLTPTVVASNETTSGTITGTEIWQGGHTLTGDVEIAPGAKLIIQPGTTITFLNGTYLDVKGNLCAADTSCGANGMGSNSSRVTFRWGTPANESATGRCYKMVNPASGQPLWNADPSCFEGILVRDTIDIAETRFNHVTVENAYGMPRYVADLGEIRWAAFILDGASPTLTEMAFDGVNTSSVLVLDLAAPTFNGGSFEVGSDEVISSLAGNAVQTYGAGSPSGPVRFLSPVFTGTENGCSSEDNGRHVLWAQKSFTNIDHGVVASGDYGYRYTDSAGIVHGNTIQTDCTGIDINGRRSISNTDYKVEVTSNTITTGDNSPLTVYDAAYAHVEGNVMSGAEEGSGIQVVSSSGAAGVVTQVRITNNIIGPITGYNGIWGVGYFDMIIDNNTFLEINREPVIVGEYHFQDSGWSVTGPAPARATINDNVINNVSGTCSSDTVWDEEDFDCPAFHIFRASATIKRNIVMGVGGDAIRAIGSLLDVQDNQFTVGGQGAKVVDHDHTYASLAFFSGNQWLGVSDIVYNITKSSVTVQSETIPSITGGNASMPIQLVWDRGEAYQYNNWDNQVILPPTQSIPPVNFPLSLQAVNNSTVFTYANMSGLSLPKIKIGASPSPWSVQVREAALVRIRATVGGVRVPGATILIEDAHGNDLYNLQTDTQGFAPWVALPSDFHLDIRGNGNNPDGFADDVGEDSCADGIDNDGDLLYDLDDPDCNAGAGTRELSKYFVTAYKFGKGYHKSSFNLTGTYEDTLAMTNLKPTVVVTQSDGHSFIRNINFTGYAWDGNIGTGVFGTAQQAQWEQQGAVQRIEVKTPDSSSWVDVRYAVDDSGTNGEVTRNNRPFKNWHFEYDMADQPEGDYTFDFRAYDGVDYSPIVTKTIKLNTNPPTINVASPVNGSMHNTGKVVFSGSASDAYNGALGSDIQEIHFRMSSPTWITTTTNIARPIDSQGNPIGALSEWSWEWDFSVMPRIRETWTFVIWASDSGYCLEDIDICDTVTLELDIDNSNAAPVISLLAPYEDETISASHDTVISGIARDTDGEVSRVEIRIRDPQDALRELPNAPPYVTVIQSNGLWSTTWDTSNMIHDFHYLISARSFDGHSYSEWVEVEVIIHNPLDADNRAPLFNSTGWVGEVIIFCEEGSQALDRCGNGGSVVLPPYFSDADGDSLDYDVYDDPEIIANSDLQHDELCADLISIDIFGRVTYDPVGMSFHTTDIDLWSCEGMKFMARDGSSSAYTMNIDFTVRAVSFSVERIDGISEITAGDTAIFTGQGRPGVEVVARSSITGLRLNNTIVGEDGIWMMNVQSNKLESGLNEVTFEYGGDSTGQSISVQVGASAQESALGWVLWAVLALVVLAGLGAVFMFFFVEFEDEPEIGDVEAQETVEEDPYAWGKASVEAEAQVATPAQPVAEPQPTYPGWKWDPETNQWIPDQ